MEISPGRVRTFVLGSAHKSAESLRAWFVNLPTEGWLIELARTHGRALLGSWTHEEFAAWIGMRGDELGRGYRLMLKRNDTDREELVQLARRILDVSPLRHSGDPRDVEFQRLQKSVEMQRFRRAREVVERRDQHRAGRPTVPVDVVGPIGKQLEAWRAELKVSVNDWSSALGMADMTYRNRLARERDKTFREKINELARDGKLLYEKMAAPVVARYDVVTRAEMVAAYGVVAKDIDRMRVEMTKDIGDGLTVNDVSDPGAMGDGEPFLPLDLYSWMRTPDHDEKEEWQS